MALGQPKKLTHTVTFKNSKKDDDAAYLEAYNLSTKTSTQHTFIEGKLVNIKISEEEFKGVKHKTVGFYLVDGEESYLLKAGWGRITLPIRNIMNRLLSATSFDNIKISYFGKKGEYKNIAVFSHGEKLAGGIDKAELDALKFEVKNSLGEKTGTDYLKLDAHLIDCIQKLVIPQLKTTEVITEEKAAVATNPPASETIPDNIPSNLEPAAEDDMPF